MRNIKIKRTTVIILMGIILAVVLAVVLIISFNKSDGNEQQADVNVSKINLKPSQAQDEYLLMIMRNHLYGQAVMNRCFLWIRMV